MLFYRSQESIVGKRIQMESSKRCNHSVFFFDFLFSIVSKCEFIHICDKELGLFKYIYNFFNTLMKFNKIRLIIRGIAENFLFLLYEKLPKKPLSDSLKNLKSDIYWSISDIWSDIFETQKINWIEWLSWLNLSVQNIYFNLSPNISEYREHNCLPFILDD